MALEVGACPVGRQFVAPPSSALPRKNLQPPRTSSRAARSRHASLASSSSAGLTPAAHRLQQPAGKPLKAHLRRHLTSPRAVSVSAEEGAATSAAIAPPQIQPIPVPFDPVYQEAAPLGLEIGADGSATFKVWAVHPQNVQLLVGDLKQGGTRGPVKSYQLARSGDYWGAAFPPGVLAQDTPYQVLITSHDGRQLFRRDPYARAADFDSTWCFADDPTQYTWQSEGWEPPSFDKYIIYEMHVGSFTPEGTFLAAAEKLEHVAKLNFTAVQLMPIAEFSCLWGYSQRQPMTLHGKYGTPEDFRKLVDKAHQLGLAVIVDIVLHHGAPDGNMLWEYDGWGPDMNGGIYHEGAHDTPWGRSWAFWKEEVCKMVQDACFRMLVDYRVDGLRFDSANDLPSHLIQRITWALHDACPGRILTAEITPEDPRGVHELGFDSLWVHSGYFDIIQQHRALGRGHHGGGDWAEGWNLPRLRQVMALHYGFEHPTQCIKYILGSHDQVGCQHGGAHYEDYKMIGGQHRYAVDQFCGGRTDANAVASARLWYTAGIAAAGLPMMFMGTEWAQAGWWHVDEWHRAQWSLAEDEIGQGMMSLVSSANALRAKYPVLRYGWPNILHEDRPNGVMACERTAEGEPRIVAVINAGRSYWQAKEYGVWVGGGVFEEIFNSQDVKFAGGDGWITNPGTLDSYDGKLWINVPPQCTLLFMQTQ